jgi:hypothetical protein
MANWEGRREIKRRGKGASGPAAARLGDDLCVFVRGVGDGIYLQSDEHRRTRLSRIEVSSLWM